MIAKAKRVPTPTRKPKAPAFDETWLERQIHKNERWLNAHQDVWQRWTALQHASHPVPFSQLHEERQAAVSKEIDDTCAAREVEIQEILQRERADRKAEA